eukprot:Phypoly_transcript_01914.p1 GENE.Phypoly_transcript_01914~~Phypoly_transcript_01914.p1  ORF type:complete len:893 (+),score=151.82 Phypoly_transcript_01914:162-2840(+)
MKKSNRRSLPAPPINIYDQFLIVGLRPDTLGPIVLSSYPSQKPASPNVALFCFPEDITHDNVNKLRMGASFFFVLTDEVGRQQVGFTRRTGKGKDMVSLCMLTHRDSSWMYTFNCLLEECEGRYKSNGGQLEPFLAALYVAPVPDPGNDIVLTYANGVNPLTLLYTRPVPCPDTTDTALFGVTMLPLLANLTTTPILQLFASLLFERRTILVSSSLERVSACVQAAVSALFPFAWHHIFIPVLPLSLVDYCSAPMPFVIGLHSSLLLSLQKMPMSEVVLVDLDRDQVSAVAGDLALLPQSLLGPLKTVLDAATADFHRITSTSKSTLDWQRVAEAFRHFFVRVFHSYARFFVQKPGADAVKFDKDAFIQAQPKQIRKFLETFCASQMFERFIAEREMGKQNVLFENEIKLYEVSQAHAGLGVQLQDKAKKSVERLSNIGATLRTHLENPFMYRREPESSPAAKSTLQPAPATLHPSLVRGQVPTDPPRRTTKPLPPIPPGATPASTSAFPPNIPVGDAPALVWDDVNDKTDTLKPAYASGRPKSATVTSTTPASNPTGTTPPMLAHSNSSSNILLAATPLPTNTNIFQFSPFEVDITPATPAPSISNSIMSNAAPVPAWFSPDSVGNNGEPAKPFYASSLPPVSMKPLNPFDDSANAHAAADQQPTHAEPNNIFTSFSLDALAPPDNVHTSGSSNFVPSSSFGVGPPSSFSSSAGGYFNHGTVTGFGSPTTSGGTVPNMANVSSGGTVPNMLNASVGIPPSGGTIPNMQTTSSGGTVPQMLNTSGGVLNMQNSQSGGTIPNVHGGGTVPNYGNAPPTYGPNGLPITTTRAGDEFDSFLSERTSSPSIPAIQVTSPILINAPAPTPTPAPIPIPKQGSADEFDSFLAARMGQL